MKAWVALFAVACMVFVTGCASIVSQSEYPVSLTSTPDGATVTVIDQDGKEIYRGVTPTQVTLKSGSGYFTGATYTVRFDKENCECRELVLEKQLDGWYIGNLVFGGLLGMLIVDPATGAMWKLPESLSADLEIKSTAFNLDQTSVDVAMLEDVPMELRDKMVKVK